MELKKTKKKYIHLSNVYNLQDYLHVRGMRFGAAISHDMEPPALCLLLRLQATTFLSPLAVLNFFYHVLLNQSKIKIYIFIIKFTVV